MVFMLQSVALAEKGAPVDEGAGMSEGAGDGKNFETYKAKALESIAKRHGLLSELESCIGSANSREDMKSCKHKHKQAFNELHHDKKEMKKEHMKEKHMKKKDRKRNRDKDE